MCQNNCLAQGITCCDICNCLDVTSSKNTISITKLDCNIDLNIDAQTIDNLLLLNPGTCITFVKDFINGQLIYTPVLNVDCLNNTVFIKTEDTTSIDLQGNGTDALKLKAFVKLNPLASNDISITSGGLYSQKINIAGGQCISFSISDILGVKTYTPVIDWNCVAVQTCGLCPSLQSCIAISYPLVSSTNATVGIPYNYSFYLTGTGPFALDPGGTYPSWLTITIVSSQVTFSGTPLIGNLGSNAINISLSNSCSNITYNFPITVNASTPACVNASFATTPNFPTGQAGVPYNYSITVNGTTPLSMNNIMKPSWMTITPTGGNSYSFTGTPTVSGSAYISFNITNCTSGYISFDQTFNVTYTALSVCKVYQITNTDVLVLTYTFTDCSGRFREGSTPTIDFVCAQESSVNITSASGTVVENGVCVTNTNCVSYTLFSPSLHSVEYINCQGQAITTSTIPNEQITICSQNGYFSAGQNIDVVAVGTC